MARGYTTREKIDWEKVETGSPFPIDPGLYGMVVTKVTVKESRGGDNKLQTPMVEVQLKVEEKFDGADDDEAIGRVVFDNLVFSQKGAFKAKQFCEAAPGDDPLEPPETNGFDDLTAFAEEIQGMQVWALVGTNTFENRVRNKVDFYCPDDDEQLKAYAEKLAGQPQDPKSSGGGAKRKRRTRTESEGNGKANSGTEDIEPAPAESKPKEEKAKKTRRRRRAET